MSRLSKLRLSADALSRTLLTDYKWSVPMVRELIRAVQEREKELKNG